MTRLYDRLMTQLPSLEARRPCIQQGWWTALRNAHVIVGDAVSDYYFLTVKDDVWDYKKHFPIVAPPWKRFWIEFRAPRHIAFPTPEGTKSWPRSGASSWGLFWSAVHREETESFLPYAANLCERWVRGRSTQRSPHPQATLEPILEHAQWLVSVKLFLQFDGHAVTGPEYLWNLAVSSAGALLHTEANPSVPVLLATAPPDSIYERAFLRTPQFKDDWFYDATPRYLHPGLLTINFLHCKNVRLETVDPPAGLIHKAKRRGTPPPTRHYTLDIEPLRMILSREGRIQRLGLQQALHLCRGHFKDFRQHGLFGKHHDLYWWNPHLRGSEALGTIEKDYRIHAPCGDTPQARTPEFLWNPSKPQESTSRSDHGHARELQTQSSKEHSAVSLWQRTQTWVSQILHKSARTP